jgi:CRP/FNR family transcriptional regulator, cyclic AMP receptor protein
MTNITCHCNAQPGGAQGAHPGCFGQAWIFEGITAQDWDKISPSLLHQEWTPGDLLFRQGDVASSMILLKIGSIKLWKVTEDGRELTLDIRNAGDFLGESSLIEEDSIYPISASCLEPTHGCGIDKKVFESLIKEIPSFGLAVIRNLSRRIDHLTGKLGALSEPNMEEKLYQVLVSVAKQVGYQSKEGWSLDLHLTHEEIGFLAGIHRVSVTRALKKLRNKGKIFLENNRMFFPNLNLS